MPTPITGFILAGGQSRRMGADKALLPWNGGTLLEHMIRTLEAAARPVYIVGRGAWPDRTPGQGPVEGLGTALARTGTEHNLVVAVDLPALTPDFLVYVAERLRRTPRSLLVCRVGAQFPLLAGARRGLRPAVDRYLAEGGRSFQGLVERSEPETVTEEEIRRAGFSPEMFRNLNSPEDYTGARRKLDRN